MRVKSGVTYVSSGVARNAAVSMGMRGSRYERIFPFVVRAACMNGALTDTIRCTNANTSSAAKELSMYASPFLKIKKKTNATRKVNVLTASVNSETYVVPSSREQGRVFEKRFSFEQANTLANHMTAMSNQMGLMKNAAANVPFRESWSMVRK